MNLYYSGFQWLFRIEKELSSILVAFTRPLKIILLHYSQKEKYQTYISMISQNFKQNENDIHLWYVLQDFYCRK